MGETQVATPSPPTGAGPASTSMSTKTVGELTRAALGREFSLGQLLELVETIEIDPLEGGSGENALWVGSVGYEKHRDVDDFARMIAEAGVKRVLDVRELPISRRRGFAKTALSEAFARAGVEYVHLRPMGNPKEFRDLYKSGKVEAGREAYREFLLSERLEELNALGPLLGEKATALMCVEDDEQICHRRVIFDALEDQVGLELEVAPIA